MLSKAQAVELLKHLKDSVKTTNARLGEAENKVRLHAVEMLPPIEKKLAEHRAWIESLSETLNADDGDSVRVSIEGKEITLRRSLVEQRLSHHQHRAIDLEWNIDAQRDALKAATSHARRLRAQLKEDRSQIKVLETMLRG